MAGDAMAAAAVGNGLTDVPLVATPGFGFLYSPFSGVSGSTGASSTAGAAVVGESEVMLSLPVCSLILLELKRHSVRGM